MSPFIARPLTHFKPLFPTSPGCPRIPQGPPLPLRENDFCPVCAYSCYASLWLWGLPWGVWGPKGTGYVLVTPVRSPYPKIS